MAELRPCPFCGGEPRLMVYTAKTDKSLKRYGVACLKCIMQMQASDTEEDAIAAWNHRYTDSTVPADIQQTIDHMRTTLDLMREVMHGMNDDGK